MRCRRSGPGRPPRCPTSSSGTGRGGPRGGGGRSPAPDRVVDEAIEEARHPRRDRQRQRLRSMCSTHARSTMPWISGRSIISSPVRSSTASSRLDEAVDALDRRLELDVHLVDRHLVGGDVERLLRREVEVQRAAGQPGDVGDLTERRAGQPARGEARDGGRQQPLPGVGAVGVGRSADGPTRRVAVGEPPSPTSVSLGIRVRSFRHGSSSQHRPPPDDRSVPRPIAALRSPRWARRSDLFDGRLVASGELGVDGPVALDRLFGGRAGDLLLHHRGGAGGHHAGRQPARARPASARRRACRRRSWRRRARSNRCRSGSRRRSPRRGSGRGGRSSSGGRSPWSARADRG